MYKKHGVTEYKSLIGIEMMFLMYVCAAYINSFS